MNRGTAQNGRRFFPSSQRVRFFALCPFGKGVASMTLTELFQFCIVLISLVNLIIQIIKKK